MSSDMRTDVAQVWDSIQKFNEAHDDQGRFASGDGGRQIYQPTAKQLMLPVTPQIPSDEKIKEMAKTGRKHTPWGLLKRDLLLSAMRSTRDFMVGMWQARVDALNGHPYHEARLTEEYNMGDHEGYLGYQAHGSDGWDKVTRERFYSTYGPGKAAEEIEHA